MDSVKNIDFTDARKRINSNKAIVIDVRDKESYNDSHINGSINISNKNFEDFINTTNKKKAVIVYCYHGNSSKNIAELLINFGFIEVYSLDGGYEMWKSKLQRS